MKTTAPFQSTAVVWLGFMVMTTPVFAQSADTTDASSQFEISESATFELPAIAPPPAADRLSTQARIFVKKVELVGNTVFSDEQLAEVTQKYEGREISSEELQQLRQDLTRYYVDNNYVNSGAVIPDQRLSDGIVTINIVEGRLTDIDIKNSGRLRDAYIESRLDIDPDAPLNIQTLQQSLSLMQQDPLIERINATLLPGLKPGEASLNAEITEAKPYRFDVIVANDRSPSVGAERARVSANYLNLSGWGDSVGATYGRTSGDADEFEAYYRLPFNAGKSTLNLSYQNGESVVIEEQFEALDIVSEIETFAIGFNHTLWQTPQQRFSLGLSLEHRRSDTSLLNIPFSFSPGVDAGNSRVTVLRFSQDWLSRSASQVLALRSTFSFGLDAFDATINDGVCPNAPLDIEECPDGEFVAWLGQFQWAKRFGDSGSQLIFRTGMQLTNEPLLPLERFSVGGAATVRGYRESLLVRDNGWISSLEFRTPIGRVPIPGISRGPDDGNVQLALFADYGRSWNKTLETVGIESISSAGLGLLWDPGPGVHAELYWGYAFRDVNQFDEDLQDRGVHFKLEWSFP